MGSQPCGEYPCRDPAIHKYLLSEKKFFDFPGYAAGNHGANNAIQYTILRNEYAHRIGYWQNPNYGQPRLCNSQECYPNGKSERDVLFNSRM